MLCARIEPRFLHAVLESIGADRTGEKIMRKKGEILLFLLHDLSLPQLHILKQELLSVGGDLATPKEAILCEKPSYNALLIATRSQLERVITKCKHQPFALKSLSQALQAHLESSALDSSKSTPEIMPIINLTPDSFYAPSRHTSERAIESIQELIAQGARLIDIGAASSRPGSPLISAQDEIARLQEVCAYIKRENLGAKARFSIDTYNAKTAAYALESGFCIVNDVSALGDKDMLAVVGDFGADFILMHTKGTPETMASLANYEHLLSEIDTFFARKLELLESSGAGEVILDIGFGFAKDSAQNLALIQHLRHFKHFGKRVLVGASQKRTIGELLNAPDPQNRLSGSLSLHLLALQNGADIIRAHHYKEHSDMLKIFLSFSKPCYVEHL